MLRKRKSFGSAHRGAFIFWYQSLAVEYILECSGKFFGSKLACCCSLLSGKAGLFREKTERESAMSAVCLSNLFGLLVAIYYLSAPS